MGKPIKKSETIKKFRKCLNKSKYRPIVILTDQSSTADTPKTYTKMDAIYIVIALNENNANYNNIEEKLNNVDTSLALMMQGSLSTIIIYLPSTQKFYHYRGIGEYRNIWQRYIFARNLSTTTKFSTTEIISDASFSHRMVRILGQ